MPVNNALRFYVELELPYFLYTGVQAVDDGTIAEYELIHRDDQHLQVELTKFKDLAAEDNAQNMRGVTVIEITTTGDDDDDDDDDDDGSIDPGQEPATDADAIQEAAWGIGAGGNGQEASNIWPQDTDSGDNRATNIPSQNIPHAQRQCLRLQSGAMSQNIYDQTGQTNNNTAIVDTTESESTVRGADSNTDDTILKCVVNHNQASHFAPPNHLSGNSPSSHQGSEQLLSARTLLQQNDDSDDQNSDANAILNFESEINSLTSVTAQQSESITHQAMPNTSLSAPVAQPVNTDNGAPAIHNSTTYRVYTGGHQPVDNADANFLPPSAQDSDIVRELRIDIRDGRIEQLPDGFLQGQIELAETHRLAKDSGTSLGSYHTDEDTDRQSDSSSLDVDASDSEIDSGRVSETESTRSYNPAGSTASNQQPHQENQSLSDVSTV